MECWIVMEGLQCAWVHQGAKHIFTLKQVHLLSTRVRR